MCVCVIQKEKKRKERKRGRKGGREGERERERESKRAKPFITKPRYQTQPLFMNTALNPYLGSSLSTSSNNAAPSTNYNNIGVNLQYLENR